MTMRERLADWISGGALTRAMERGNAAIHAAKLNNAAANDAIKSNRILIATGTRQATALRAVIGMETPGANATVRRMAQVAREALE